MESMLANVLALTEAIPSVQITDTWLNKGNSYKVDAGVSYMGVFL